MKLFHIEIQNDHKFIKRTENLSPAYIISSVSKKNIKGVILFLHAGVHFDFSPRWDPLLMNLSNNGYIILAPNSPMSFGFGKSFYNLPFSDILLDIKKWKNFIIDNYKDVPLYYLSYSAENAVMELSLSEDSNNVNASGSFFGVPAKLPNPSVLNLYILGEKDPLVNFTDRSNNLRSNQENKNISFVSYKDEGHLFRNTKNLQDALNKLMKFFCRNK